MAEEIVYQRQLEAIFCDDIRQEQGNLISMMGVYSTTLEAQSFPLQLPKFCVHIRIVTPADRPLHKLKMVVSKDGEELMSGELDSESLKAMHEAPTEIETGEPAKAFLLSTQFIAAGLVFEEPCRLRVSATTESETLHAVGLRIKLAG